MELLFAELPPPLFDWRLFQETGDRSILRRRHSEQEWFWKDPLREGPQWDEEAFHRWVRRYSQVGVIDPADPKGRPREFETRLVAWMATHPGFEVRAQESVTLEPRPGVQQTHRVVIYGRRE